MARKIVAGNWKINMLRPEAESFFQSFEKSMERIPADVEVYLFPSYPHLASFPAGSRCVLGAQNFSDHKPGAYTGEVSIEMLASYGVKAVIIGHSERRLPCHEGSIVLDRKVQRAREAEMTIFYCVGEPEAVRNLGMDSVWQFVSVQLETVKFVDPEKLVIAYDLGYWYAQECDPRGCGVDVCADCRSDAQAFSGRGSRDLRWELQCRECEGSLCTASRLGRLDRGCLARRRVVYRHRLRIP